MCKYYGFISFVYKKNQLNSCESWNIFIIFLFFSESSSRCLQKIEMALSEYIIMYIFILKCQKCIHLLCPEGYMAYVILQGVLTHHPQNKNYPKGFKTCALNITSLFNIIFMNKFITLVIFYSNIIYSINVSLFLELENDISNLAIKIFRNNVTNFQTLDPFKTFLHFFPFNNQK